MSDFLLTNHSSKRLDFRQLTTSDFEAWLPFHENPLSNQYWSGIAKDPRTACANQIEKILERYKNKAGGLNALISKESKKLIGLCGLLTQEINGKEELEIGYSILPKYWQQGFAFEAAEKCKQVAFENKWATSLISIIQIDNIPSQKTAAKNGMHIDFETTFHNNQVYIYRIHK